MRYWLCFAFLIAFFNDGFGQRKKPVIIGQNFLSTNEEQSITIRLTDLKVTDRDDFFYPWGFSLTVYTGDNYSLSGHTVTPNLNFSGVLTVPVSVNDGKHESDQFSLKITVNPINDPPVITAQTPLSTVENTGLVLKLSDLTVIDPDNVYPTGFTIIIENGSNYSASGNTITPNVSFTGNLTAQVKVSDGAASSPPFSVKISVTPANKKPTITEQQALTATSGQPLTIQLSNLTVTDPDNIYPNDFTLSIKNGSNYTVSGTNITPVADFTGTLTIPVTVNDGKVNSDAFNLAVTVIPANKKPVITGQTSLVTSVNKSIMIQLSHLTVTDSDNTYPADFTLSIATGQNYTVANNVITPEKDFTGSLTVKVTVNDGNADSDPFDLKITVDADATKPIITGQVILATSVNIPITIQLSHLLVSDSDNAYPTGFTLTVSGGTNYSLAANVVTPAQNFKGTLSVPVTVNDGTSTSEVFTLKIDVSDQLLIIGHKALEVSENESLSLKLSDLSVTDPTNTYPTGFTLKLSAGDNYTFTGVTITPAKDFTGELSIPVTVSKGDKTSNVFNVTIAIVPVNTPPEIITLETEGLRYEIGSQPIQLTAKIEIIDNDDEYLELAEIGFQPETYHYEDDELLFTNHESIRGVFDASAGKLTLLGKATLQEYRNAIRSVRYTYKNVEDPLAITKTVYIKLSDGNTISEARQREILLEDKIELDIPNGFTPNNDFANDTWNIKAAKNSERFDNAVIHVYDKRGVMVYEGKGLKSAWDGTHNGKSLPPDTYYYTIDLHLINSTENFKGIVTILR